MRAARLRSSLIDRAVFDDAAGELTLCFKAGRNYIYSGVPRAVFDIGRSGRRIRRRAAAAGRRALRLRSKARPARIMA